MKKLLQHFKKSTFLAIVSLLVVGALNLSPHASAASSLGAGSTLASGGQIQSADGHYTLIMQGDGNLVEYVGSRVLWASNTNRAGSDLEMQGDGNLVIYAPGHVAVWASNTANRNGATVVLQNDANLVIV